MGAAVFGSVVESESGGKHISSLDNGKPLEMLLGQRVEDVGRVVDFGGKPAKAVGRFRVFSS